MNTLTQIVESSPQRNSEALSKLTRPLTVALISMPWSSVKIPSLALGILKQLGVDAGHSVEVFHLNMLLADRLSLPVYEAFAGLPVTPEWFFVPSLSEKPAISNNDHKQALENALASAELRELRQQASRFSSDPIALCSSIAVEDVPSFLSDCENVTDWSRFDVVGFTTTFSQTMASVVFAQHLKAKHPRVKIVFGGANVDGEMGIEVLKGFPCVDFVVHGEAEVIFPQLLHYIGQAGDQSHLPLALPSGVSHRAFDGSVHVSVHTGSAYLDLENSPAPDYSDYIADLRRYNHRDQVQLRLYFESSRGCWWGAKHHCTFCGLNGMTMAYRAKTPSKVLRELREMSRKYKCLSFFACDNILAREYFTSLLPQLAAEDLDFDFFYEVKANLTKQQVALLAASGIRDIQPGIESLNTRLLGLMNKGITAIQNIQLIKWCKELQVAPLWNLLYGFPGECAADYSDYPRLFKLLNHLQPPSGFIRVIFERFSPYHFNADAYGIKLTPSKIYDLLFAETAVNLDKIAYYFDAQYSHPHYDADASIEELIIMVEEWKSRFWANETYCTYSRGQDFLLITDARDSQGKKQYSLDGHLAAAYQFCDENRSFSAISRFVTERSDGRTSNETLKYWLSQLVDAGLMLEEKDRYLSLAIKEPVRYERH